MIMVITDQQIVMLKMKMKLMLMLMLKLKPIGAKPSKVRHSGNFDYHQILSKSVFLPVLFFH